MCPKCGGYTTSFTNPYDVRVLEYCPECGHVEVLWPEAVE